MNTWTEHAFVYHLYPLGALGAPWTNPGGAPVSRLPHLEEWIAPAERVGANTLLLGPLWESGTHGYDTHDYHTVDRRLGTNDELATALAAWKSRGFRLVFDGVFHHCGRGFAPFQDLVTRGEASPYRSWFSGVDFGRSSPFGDPFAYDGWNGHHSLVKFNLSNPDVKVALFAAVAEWIDRYDLDGLRLDAADVIDKTFLGDLAAFCRARKPDFWLMGEVIHGDYNAWAPGAGLDAVTNYELFKGLWSSHNDANYFEAAWSLNRQFGPQGVYRDQRHLVFGDNHDVDRLASTLNDEAHLYTHAILQAAAPGIPAVYYGSEAGLTGRKTPTSDEPLRPALRPADLDALPHQPLRSLWSTLAGLRRAEPSLRRGHYRQALVASRQLAFWREAPGARAVLVAVNSAPEPVEVAFDVGTGDQRWVDLLNPEATWTRDGSTLRGTLWPTWGAVLAPA